MLKAPKTRLPATLTAIAAAAALAGTAFAADAAPKAQRPPPSSRAQAGPGPPPASDAPHLVYSVEQLVSGELPPTVQSPGLGPLHTLREVEDLLKSYDIAFKWNKIEIKSAELDPAMVKQIAALPPGEVFVVPQGQPLGQIMVFDVILKARAE